MPQSANYGAYQEQVNAFNQKYGVNFSYGEFESNVLKMQSLKRNFNAKMKDMTMEDSIYRGMFLNLYKQSAHSFVDRKIGKFFYADFLKDYEALISNYRTECEKTGYPKPSVRGAWTKESDIAKSIKEKLADVKSESQDDVEDRYEKRELRIRDMRAYAEQLRDRGETSVEKISALFVYANALESYNQKRNFFSRTFGTQGRAERKNARDIRAIANALIGDDPKRKRELERAIDVPMGRMFKNEIEIAVDHTLKKEKAAEERRQIKIENDKPPAELRDFLEIGYRPNLAALDEEWEVVEPFYDAVVKQNKYWAEHNVENLMRREVFQKNYIRLKLFRDMAIAYGGGTPKYVVDVYQKTEMAWSIEDNQLKSHYPEYSPKIPAGYGENSQVVGDVQKSEEKSELQNDGVVNETVLNAANNGAREKVQINENDLGGFANSNDVSAKQVNVPVSDKSSLKK